MVRSVVVGRARVAGAIARRGHPRTEVESLLEEAVAPYADRGVLLVRQLRVDPTDRDAARRELASLRAVAARPAAGAVDAGAPAVAFDDEAELVACFLRDVVSGQAGQRWYWSWMLAAGDPVGSAVARALRVRVRWLPAAVRLADRLAPGTAVAAFALLDRDEARGLLGELLTEFGGAGQAPAHGSPVLGLVSGSEASSIEAAARRWGWARLAAGGDVFARAGQGRLSDEAGVAMTAARVLATDPGAAGTPQFVPWLCSIPGGRAASRGPRHTDTAWGVAGPVRGADAGGGDGGTDRPGRSDSADRTDRLDVGEPVTGSPGEPSTPGAVGAGTVPAGAVPAGAVRANTVGFGAESGSPATRSAPGSAPTDPSAGGPGPRGDGEPVARWTRSGAVAVPTAFASALYVVNLILRLGPPDPDHPGPRGWARVAALARHLLRDVVDSRALAGDPLWALLAGLDHDDHGSPDYPFGHPLDDPLRHPPGRPLDDPLGHPPVVRLGPDAETAQASLAAAGITGAAFAVPGYVCANRTHVDVVLPLERVDLRVRRAGLDVDPGWVPALRRIIAIHFEDADQLADLGSPDAPQDRSTP